MQKVLLASGLGLAYSLTIQGDQASSVTEGILVTKFPFQKSCENSASANLA